MWVLHSRQTCAELPGAATLHTARARWSPAAAQRGASEAGCLLPRVGRGYLAARPPSAAAPKPDRRLQGGQGGRGGQRGGQEASRRSPPAAASRPCNFCRPRRTRLPPHHRHQPGRRSPSPSPAGLPRKPWGGVGARCTRPTPITPTSLPLAAPAPPSLTCTPLVLSGRCREFGPNAAQRARTLRSTAAPACHRAHLTHRAGYHAAGWVVSTRGGGFRGTRARSRSALVGHPR